VGGSVVTDVGRAAEFIEGVGHVHGVPQDDGVRDDGQAEGLLGLALVMAVPHVALVGEEELAT
jgi:hypothetical protein